MVGEQSSGFSNKGATMSLTGLRQDSFVEGCAVATQSDPAGCPGRVKRQCHHRLEQLARPPETVIGIMGMTRDERSSRRTGWWRPFLPQRPRKNHILDTIHNVPSRNACFFTSSATFFADTWCFTLNLRPSAKPVS